MSKHLMMLSDLYGRIGQILRENGDAPLGNLVIPKTEGVYTENELIRPFYVDVVKQKTKMGNIEIQTYNIEISE